MAGIDKTVKLLLHGDGSDNGTTITDSSLYAKTMSRTGNTCTKTGTKKFGTAAIYFDGTGDYLTAPDHADWNFAKDDFCIDLWVNFSSLPGSNTIAGLLNQYSSSSVYWRLAYIDVSGTKSLVFQNNTTTICTYNVTFTTGQWYHIAVSRKNVGGTRTTRLFIDGAIVHSVTTDYTISDIATVLYIGSGAAAASYFTGYLDEVRVCHYEPKYIDTFTPPTEAYSLSQSTWYMDCESGDDNLSGSSWTTAWKSMKYGAALVSPGDIVRIKKSPDPVSIGNATWTHDSATVTLASALTTEIDNCESGWTAATNVTATYDSTQKKQGSYGLKLAVGASFTTGKMAYKSIANPSALDFSAYVALSCWMRLPNGITSSHNLRICLCSDNTGDTVVDSFPLVPSTILVSSYWVARRIAKGSALGSSISSIAIYIDTDPGAVNFYFDNILACNDFSLCSLITKKDTNNQYEPWYSLTSIVGTTLEIDQASMNTRESTLLGYYGTSGSNVTTYRREPIPISISDNFVVQKDGTAGNLIQFLGGWDSGLDEVNGQTYIDCQGTNSAGTLQVSKNYNKISHFNLCRGYLGVSITGNYNELIFEYLGHHFTTVINVAGKNNSVTIKDLHNISTSYNAITIDASSYFCTVDIQRVICSGRGLDISGFGNHITFDLIAKCLDAAYAGIMISGGYNNIFGGTVKDNAGRAVQFYNTNTDNSFYNITSQDNDGDTISVGSGSGTQRFYNLTQNESVVCSALDSVTGNTVKIMGLNSDKTYNLTKNTKYEILSQTTVRHTASGVAWKVTLTTTGYVNELMPAILPLCKIACTANTQVTVACYFRRTNTGISGKLVCKGYQIAGVDSDVSDSITEIADTWEQLSISFTPTESGVVQIEAHAYGGNTYSVYVDDLTIS